MGVIMLHFFVCGLLIFNQLTIRKFVYVLFIQDLSDDFGCL